jgi:hypothetical protein
MSKIVLILAASSAGLGLLSLHLVKEMRAGQATIGELQAQVATLEQQQKTQAQLALAAPISQLQKETKDEVVVAPPPQEAVFTAFSVKRERPEAAQPQMPSREERMRMMREGRERQRALMQDPEYRDAMRVQNRNNFARSYPGVADALGMDPQQTDQFFELLAEQQMRATDQLQPMWDMEGKDQATLEEQQRKVQQQALDLQRKSEAEIAAQLGQDKLQAWKDYQATLGVRHQLEQMRSSLANQGMPITDDLNKSMIKAMAEAHKAEADEYSAAVNRGAGPRPFSSGSFTTEMVERQLEATKKRNQRTLDAISPYLTYEQRQAIEREQEAQLKLQQAHMRVMRAQGNSLGQANVVVAPGTSPQGVLVPLQ